MGRDDERVLRIEQRDVRTIKKAAPAFRRLEIACIFAFPFAWAWLLLHTYKWAAQSPFLAVVAGVSGLLASDFISGIFHWFFDTWFTPDTPYIGRAFVRTFREHHVDPQAICRHDFVETNGSNILSGDVLIVAGYFSYGGEASTPTQSFLAFAFLISAVFMAATSQIHRWAHADSVPLYVTILQRSRLILSKPSHALHHFAPFDRSYCITCGWLNAPLRLVGFFRTLERIISGVTGVLPRQDDIGEEAAAIVAGEIVPAAPADAESPAN